MVRIAIAYSSKDLDFKNETRTRLAPLQRSGLIEVWDDQDILPGEDENAAVQKRLETSEIILLLLSPDMLNSDDFYQMHAPIALRRHLAGEAIAVVVVLRPCLWDTWHTKFTLNQCELLPEKGRPVSEWPNADEAYFSISLGIDSLLKRLKKQAEVLKSLEASMILVRGGTYYMGDFLGEGTESEKPPQEVSVADFYLCKYAVTQELWVVIMDDNPSDFKGEDNANLLPVENVSWDDAQAFIRKLNERTGLKYRLPSEAEWEYAAREGGKKIRFGNSKNIADSNEMNFNAQKDIQSYSKEGQFRKTPLPVNSFLPNELGFYNMSGNIWEWCDGLWHQNYENGVPKAITLEGNGDNEMRTRRGGSWDSTPTRCRVSYRIAMPRTMFAPFVGFRIARDC